jgi:hypothetical protein
VTWGVTEDAVDGAAGADTGADACTGADCTGEGAGAVTSAGAGTGAAEAVDVADADAASGGEAVEPDERLSGGGDSIERGGGCSMERRVTGRGFAGAGCASLTPKAPKKSPPLADGAASAVARTPALLERPERCEPREPTELADEPEAVRASRGGGELTASCAVVAFSSPRPGLGFTGSAAAAAAAAAVAASAPGAAAASPSTASSICFSSERLSSLAWLNTSPRLRLPRLHPLQPPPELIALSGAAGSAL